MTDELRPYPNIGEWSPGGYGWCGDRPPADGRDRRGSGDARAVGLARKAAGDRTVYGHSLACGNSSSTCGACILAAIGLNVQSARGPEKLELDLIRS